jgi:peptidoglycan/LPS O-acetylase OafA/YrhL
MPWSAKIDASARQLIWKTFIVAARTGSPHRPDASRRHTLNSDARTFRSRRAARYRNVVSRLLTTPSALVLGDANYMIYLVHYVVLMIATKLIGSAVHGAIFTAIAIILSTIATLVVSILLYACYESPVRKWLRRLWRRERPPVVTAKI